MNENFDFKGNKGFRLIYIFERLTEGEVVKKSHLSQDLSVSEKSIQRDIQDLRMYLAETRFYTEEINIKYDKIRKGYYLTKTAKEQFTNKEILVLSNILLESKVFRKNEIEALLKKLFLQSTPGKQFEYMHSTTYPEKTDINNTSLIDLLWNLSICILEEQLISFTYGSENTRTEFREVKPVSILFSEKYFFLTVNHVRSETTSYSTIRIDRIQTIAL